MAPEGPPLQILLDGGVGGAGGLAIRNGYGVNRFEIPPGMGGEGGDGGAAEIFYDGTAPELERKVVIINRGGPGGGGGAGNGSPGRPGPLPRTHPEAVRRLFTDELAHGVPVRIHGSDRADRKSIDSNRPGVGTPRPGPAIRHGPAARASAAPHSDFRYSTTSFFSAR